MSFALIEEVERHLIDAMFDTVMTENERRESINLPKQIAISNGKKHKSFLAHDNDCASVIKGGR